MTWLDAETHAKGEKLLGGTILLFKVNSDTLSRTPERYFDNLGFLEGISICFGCFFGISAHADI